MAMVSLALIAGLVIGSNAMHPDTKALKKDCVDGVCDAARVPSSDPGSSLLQSRFRDGSKTREGTREGTRGAEEQKKILYSPIEPMLTSANRGMVIMEHRLVGCFPRAKDDTPGETTSNYMDRACVNTTGRPADAGACRSGLPFFRVEMKDSESFLDCFGFCLSKGLDLFGVMAQDEHGAAECRCGASAANAEAWHLDQPRPEALLPQQAVSEEDPDCAMIVWQYTGGFEADGIPVHLVTLTEAEEAYLDSVATGEDIWHVEDVNEPQAVVTPNDTESASVSLVGMRSVLKKSGADGQLAHKGLCQDSTSTGWTLGNGKELTCEDVEKYKWCSLLKTACPITCGVCTAEEEGSWLPCYPGSCAGMSSWLNKRADGRVIVNYFFDDTINLVSKPEDAKAAFRAAAEEYAEHTCIMLVEGTVDSAPMPRIIVGHYDSRSCWAMLEEKNGVGAGKYSGKINLGWCRTMYHKGTMVHEISHVLGVHHEQKRADAGAEIELPDGSKHGPALTIKWQNIPVAWRPQWKPTESTYIGSGDQGEGDPKSGYAPYDYESIMQYYAGRSATATVAWATRVMGQRARFSGGDIVQLNDMYQCTILANDATATAGDYYSLAKGARGCPEEDVITTEEECHQALEALDVCHGKPWTGSSDSAPKYCSANPDSDPDQCGEQEDMHFNTGAGGSSADLAPICKKAAPTPAPTPKPTPAPTPKPTPKQAGPQYKLGPKGKDWCPKGYRSILGTSECQKASKALGKPYNKGQNAKVGKWPSVCNLCQGCKWKSTRVSPSHGRNAYFVCVKKSSLAQEESEVSPTEPEEKPPRGSSPAELAQIQVSNSSLLASVWRVTPWSLCKARSEGHPEFAGKCLASCARTREVECVDAATGATLPDSSCEATMKLADAELCHCPTTSPCMDQCNPGFTSMEGKVLDCKSEEVSYWCTHESSDEKMLSVIRNRCPATCGLCAA